MKLGVAKFKKLYQFIDPYDDNKESLKVGLKPLLKRFNGDLLKAVNYAHNQREELSTMPPRPDRVKDVVTSANIVKTFDFTYASGEVSKYTNVEYEYETDVYQFLKNSITTINDELIYEDLRAAVSPEQWKQISALLKKLDSEAHQIPYIYMKLLVKRMF